MKSTVMKVFIDKNTGVQFEVGQSFEADRSRLNELVELGYVKAEFAEEEPEKKVVPKRAKK